MNLKKMKPQPQHQGIILYSIFCVFCAFIVIANSKGVGLKVFDFMAAYQDKKLTSYLDQERNNVTTHVTTLSKNELLKEDIKNNDTAAIRDILHIQEPPQLSSYTVTDANGFSLLRVPLNANLGDNTFLTTASGRSTAKGLVTAVYGAGRNFPLTIGSGALIKDGDTTIGAVFGGYWLNNNYAKAFKERHLNDFRKREIIFYSKEDGVTGNSLEDKSAEKRLLAYLSHASTIIQDGRSGDLLNINGTDYVITNHLLTDNDKIYGGALLLTPIPATLLIRSGVVSLVIALLFFISLLHFEKISVPQLLRFRKKSLYILLFCLSGFVFISIWGGIYAYGKAFTLHVDTPEFVIYNSTMKLRPDSGVYTVGYQQQLAVIVYSGGEEINSTEVHMRFDPRISTVDSLSFDRSICSPETIVEQSIDNVNGTITVSCIITSEAFSEARGIIADINFTPKAIGNAAFTFDEGTRVLAADGLGTDVLRSVTSGFYRVFDEKDLEDFFSENVLVIPYSSTHENSSRWYSSQHIDFVWPKIHGAQYMYEFSTDATTIIHNPIKTSATSVSLDAPSDGVFYFKLAAVHGDEQGLASVFKVKIDTKPPTPPIIKASKLNIKKDDVVRFEFSSSDETSGLQKNFYVRVDRSAWLPTFSRIFMPFHEKGNHELGVRAFDNAENYSDSEIIIKTTR